MPQLQSLILTDRATTPVNHTFVPETITRLGVASVVKSDGTPVGDKKLTIATRKSATRRRISIRLAVPVVQTQTINGISTPLAVRTAHANVEFNFDVNSTTQERKDTVGMLASALDSSKVLVNSTVVDLEGVY